MSSCSLLLSAPIPRESIQLGRLVLDPKYPTEDFCQPSLPRASGDATDGGLLPTVATSTFKDFSEIMERARGTRLEFSLLEALSLTPFFSKSKSTNISSPLLVTQELADANGYFTSACHEAYVRQWLEKNLCRPFQSVHLVSGLRVLTDPVVKGEKKKDYEMGVTATAPASLVTAAAGVPIPLPDIDVASAGVTETGSSKGTVEYTALGEYVFAVAYRKISFSLFSTRKVDEAYVQRGNRWKSVVAFRGAADEDDGVDVDVSGPLDSEDLLGQYEGFDLDGEQLLYQVDEDDPAQSDVV